LKLESIRCHYPLVNLILLSRRPPSFSRKWKVSSFTYFPIHNTVPFYNVSTINPEAGKHNIPEDKLEIEAAFRAGVTTWEEFPYYAWRYGLRGKQYTRSDSVWLVTLCDLEEEVVIEQVHWLGRVLASRGMPQWLLSSSPQELSL
jgi:hypothetical protein